MIVLRSTMDAALDNERALWRDERAAFYRQYGEALDRVTALQKQMSAWITGKTDDGVTPEQMAQMFYAQDDRWQAAFFNTMQAQVTAHHDTLPSDNIWGKCPGVPAGEAQWWHMAQHLDANGFETLVAMFEHAKHAQSEAEAA